MIKKNSNSKKKKEKGPGKKRERRERGRRRKKDVAPALLQTLGEGLCLPKKRKTDMLTFCQFLAYYVTVASNLRSLHQIENNSWYIVSIPSIARGRIFSVPS